MKTLIIYDSAYGNTEKIAQSVASAIRNDGEVKVLRVSEVTHDRISGIDLLVVGSPTQRFRATPDLSEFLKQMPDHALDGIGVATFDTRFTEEKIKDTSRVLKFFVGVFGYAAKPIAEQLVAKGGHLVLPPEGFYVNDTEGPLLEGELQRAEAWGQLLVTKSK